MDGRERYSRNILFWGEEKQKILRGSTVLVAGVGGLGTTVSQLLARGGVGRLLLVDDGTVDWPDLNRQTLYGECDVGRRKVRVAAERLARINAGVELVPLEERIDSSFSVPGGVSAVADCLDNFATRFALFRGTPDGTFFVHAGVQGEHGQVLTLRKGISHPLDAVFAGARQPAAPLAVTPDCVAVMAGLQAREIFHALWSSPRLLDRFLVVDLDSCVLSFLEV